jgi:hypothetical protein
MDNDNRRPVRQRGQAFLPELADLPARTARQVALLERDSPRLVRRASLAGADITYLGIAPMSAEPTAYAGQDTDWIIRPAADGVDTVIPSAERERLLRLLEAGIDFPLIYVAHEIPKDRLALSTRSAASPDGLRLDQAAADQAIGDVPPSPETVETADRLGRNAERMLRILRTALPIAAGVLAVPVVAAAAPFLLVGAAAAAVAGLDPIVFGVVPAEPGPPMPGALAAWYVLAQWDWPGGTQR